MLGNFKLITAPVSEPLSLDDAKDHLGIMADETGEDDKILSYISAARAVVESQSGLQLLTATYDVYFDRFESEMVIHKSPIQSITSIKYIDTDGVEQTISASDYKLNDVRKFPSIKAAYGKSWPSTRCEDNAVVIRFVSGFTSSTLVPDQAIHAIKLLIRQWYDSPNNVEIGHGVKTLPFAVKVLINQIKVWDKV